MYKGYALGQQNTRKTSGITRRDFVKGIAEGTVLVLLEPVVLSLVADLPKPKPAPDIANIGRNEKGLYAKFRDYNFRFIEDYLVEKKDYFSHALQEEEQPNAVLYRVNHSKNPNFKIKGDRLDRLRDLAGIVNNHSNAIRSLKQGEEIKLPWNSKTLNTLKPGAYFIPYYYLQK